MMNVPLPGLCSLCLMISISGCGATAPIVRTELVEIPIEVYIPVPGELTAPVRPPQLPAGQLVNDDLVDYIEQLRGVLDHMNDDRSRIESLQRAAP